MKSQSAASAKIQVKTDTAWKRHMNANGAHKHAFIAAGLQTESSLPSMQRVTTMVNNFMTQDGNRIPSSSAANLERAFTRMSTKNQVTPWDNPSGGSSQESIDGKFMV